MQTPLTKRTICAVRDELEQALYSLPRTSDAEDQIAHQIEEAIDIVLEIELSLANPLDGNDPSSYR